MNKNLPELNRCFGFIQNKYLEETMIRGSYRCFLVRQQDSSTSIRCHSSWRTFTAFSAKETQTTEAWKTCWLAMAPTVRKRKNKSLQAHQLPRLPRVLCSPSYRHLKQTLSPKNHLFSRRFLHHPKINQ